MVSVLFDTKGLLVSLGVRPHVREFVAHTGLGPVDSATYSYTGRRVPKGPYVLLVSTHGFGLVYHRVSYKTSEPG